MNEIVGIITKSKDCTALVVDTVDRLQRSFKESVVLLDLLKQGNPVNLSKIDDVLKGSFYYGIMNTKDGPYPHRALCNTT